MKDSWSWSHMSIRTSDGNCLKNFCQFVQKQRQERKEDLKSSMEIAKLFALHPTAKKKTRMAMANIFALSENAKN